jgi:uncharacterized protein
VGIEFDDSKVDVGSVDDRRGGRGGGALAIGGGGGLVGLIIVILFQVLGGGSGGGGQLQLPPGLDGGQANSSGQQESSQQLSDRCNASGALDTYTDCRLIKEFTIADTVWKQEFARRGVDYQSPRIAFFDQQTQTGCGNATAEVGPFYCPPDQEIYFELTFLDTLQSQFGAQGTFAQAYIVAHEFGHHLQTLLGTERKVRAAQQQNPSQQNQYSIALELQADCYAGVWAKLADQQSSGGIKLSADNIAEAQKAAAAVGDDKIQQKMQGRVNPEGWTHGSAADRQKWFTTGYQQGNIDDCNTFG